MAEQRKRQESDRLFEYPLDGVSSTNILVRLDFAESILRRDLQGISLKPVELV